MMKINQLIKDWPKGTIKTVKELEESGYTPQLLKSYSNSKWIELFGRGMYKLYKDNVDWQGILYGIQRKSSTTLHAGAKTALTLKGYGHYLSLGESKVYLFSDMTENFNAWLKKSNQMVLKRNRVFDYSNKDYFMRYNTGNFEIIISSPELAIMEMLYLVPQDQSFDESLKIMEGLTTLRPKIIQGLLETSKSVKVKRLFLFMADKSQHSWLKDLDLNKINLGKGKRMIVENGLWDNKFLITYPRS
jgi:hypothetical protein